MRIKQFRQYLLLLSSILMVTGSSSSAAQAPVEADKHSCGELVQMVADAGELQINARTRNPNGSENYNLHTFISPATRCRFADERPSQWRIYAGDKEICEDLNVCLPRSLGR